MQWNFKRLQMEPHSGQPPTGLTMLKAELKFLQQCLHVAPKSIKGRHLDVPAKGGGNKAFYNYTMKLVIQIKLVNLEDVLGFYSVIGWGIDKYSTIESIF